MYRIEMKERIYRVTFRTSDIAFIPPCGLGAALNSMDDTIRSILSRYADDASDGKLTFGHNEVEIKNGSVKVYQDNEEDTEKIVEILKHYFSVHLTDE